MNKVPLQLQGQGDTHDRAVQTSKENHEILADLAPGSSHSLTTEKARDGLLRPGQHSRTCLIINLNRKDQAHKMLISLVCHNSPPSELPSPSPTPPSLN